MHLTKYHPPIRRLQEDFAARLARKRMLARKDRPPKSKITDNSVPWMENPDSIADFWYIACRVNATVEAWNKEQAILEGRETP